jgi:predicted XRE-type DNA-binding protein
MSRLDEIRLMAKVARMCYDQGIRQQEITERLNIHQSKISRMLRRAREANIYSSCACANRCAIEVAAKIMQRIFAYCRAIVP